MEDNFNPPFFSVVKKISELPLLTLLGILVATAFIPEYLIHYSVVLTLAITGVFLFFKGFKNIACKGAGATFGAIVIYIPAAFVITLFCGSIVLYFPHFMLWPTAINLIASLLLTIKLTKNIKLGLPLMILISATLGFNTRIPAMVEDALYEHNKMSIIRPLTLTSNQTLALVSQKNEYNFLPLPFAYPFVGVPFDGPHYLQIVPSVFQNIVTTLAEQQIKYKVSDKSASGTRLEIFSEEVDGGVKLVFSLFDGNEQIAKLETRRRLYYPFEPNYITQSPNPNDLNNFGIKLQILAHSNLWNILLESLVLKGKEASYAAFQPSLIPFRNFLINAINVTNVAK